MVKIFILETIRLYFAIIEETEQIIIIVENGGFLCVTSVDFACDYFLVSGLYQDMPKDFRLGKWSWILLPLVAFCGWLVFASQTPKTGRVAIERKLPNSNTSKPFPAMVPAISPKTVKVAPPGKTDPHAKSREWLVKFRSPAELQAFLAKVRQMGGRVLAVIPRLGAARIAFDSDEQGQAIRDLVPQSASASLNYLVSTPTTPDPQTDTGGPYLGFGREALTWLGVPADNAKWGKGVTVAVLDTGIYDVPGLSLRGIRQIDLIGGNMTGVEMQDHGTAVASIIGGSAEDARGVAPGASLLSVRVLDNNGVGDSFTVAQGVMDAVDGGARVISMSIASAGDSQVLRDAVNYALARNVAVVAAVGNEGFSTVDYPGRYPGVISVTAVDANGQRGGFSNFGQEVTLAAPGIGVITPWLNQQEVNFSGTSAAVPFVSGTLAMLFSENPSLTAAQAKKLLVNYSNDAGAPGSDPFFGAGILDVSRLLNRNQSGINDGAVADFYFDPKAVSSSSIGVPVKVTVQNRGTTTLSSLTLDVNNNGQLQHFYLNSLPAGSVTSRTIEVNPAALLSEQGVNLQSRVLLNGVQDSNSTNNNRSMTLRLNPPSD